MTAPLSNLTAFILAGGKSTRMGTDKALLKLGEKTLLEHMLSVTRELTGDVRICGSRTRFATEAQVVEDIFPERGPLGGIHAALKSTETELNLVLSVDTPFVTPQLLRYLVSQVTHGDVVTVPRAGGRWHPLCAVYRRSFAALAEAALQSGRNKIDALFSETRVHTIEQEELSAAGFSSVIFRNLNTPEEFQQASSSWPNSDP